MKKIILLVLALIPATVFAQIALHGSSICFDGGVWRIRAAAGKMFNVIADTVDFKATVAAGANAGTLANSPVLGNSTVWIAVKVGGVTKYVPAW